MKQSLLRKLLVTIWSILFGTFIIGQIIGYFVIKSWFLHQELKEAEPLLQEIADEIKINNEEIIISWKLHFIIKAYDLNNNEIPIVETDDKKGGDYYSDEEIKSDLLPYMTKALTGNMVASLENFENIKGKWLILGVPIKENGYVLGTVFALEQASDFDVIINGFYTVFFITSLIATIIILVLIYYFARKLIKPLTEMVEVSNSMSSGNFSVRAKGNGYGEIKELSKSLNNLAKRLFENDKSAQMLEQTRRDYIANVSHELRTPISSIRAIAETLSDNIELDEDKKHKYNLIVLRESKRLQKLINDMLELSRLQSGEMAISKSIVSGNKIISEISEYFEIFAEDLDIKFIITENALNAPELYSNESRISQVLFILLDNAFKFTQDNGYVKLDAVCEEELVRLIVENIGDGISDEDIQFIFERFYKSDKSHNGNGSGLGLSIAKEIIRNLDEEIYVVSESGKKTKFEFTVHRNAK